MKAELQLSLHGQGHLLPPLAGGQLITERGECYDISHVISDEEAKVLNVRNVVGKFQGFNSEGIPKYDIFHETYLFKDKDAIIAHLPVFIEQRCSHVDVVWQDEEHNVVYKTVS